MEIASSSGNTDNHREHAHQTLFPDIIKNFALGVGSVKKQHVVVDIHIGDNSISPNRNSLIRAIANHSSRPGPYGRMGAQHDIWY